MAVDYLLYYSKSGKKETEKRYRTPVTVEKARADAIALLRADKVGQPPIPFSMVCVALMKDVKPGMDPYDGLTGQVILSRASVRNNVTVCGRYWDTKKHKWVWINDSGTIKTGKIESW